MNKKIFILSSIVLLLSACNGAKSGDVITCISPKGAPALAFYDQGKNEDTFVTSSTPTNVLAQLQKNEYDCVVFDSVNGLKSIKKNGSNYKLARIITGGNFYLVCINKEPNEQGEYPLPSETDVVVSFGQSLIPDLVYSRLCTQYWHIENNAKYVNSNEDALAVLVSGKYSSGDVDYVFIAEPALTNALNNSEADTYGKVHIVKNIRKEWKAYSGQDGLAQAGVFVNSQILETKKDSLKTYFNDLDNRIENAINNPSLVAEEMNKYGDAKEQASRFGFNANLVSKVQGDGNNGFGLVSNSETIDVNTFLTSLGQDTFSDEYFVKI